jgi:hypothetical protein
MPVPMVAVNQFGVNWRMISLAPVWGVAQLGGRVAERVFGDMATSISTSLDSRESNDFGSIHPDAISAHIDQMNRLLPRWLHFASAKMLLTSGNAEAAATAHDLCEDGPVAAKPDSPDRSDGQSATWALSILAILRFVSLLALTLLTHS